MFSEVLPFSLGSPLFDSALYPPPKLLVLQLEDVQLSRFLVCMEASGIPYRLLLNKADLVTEKELEAQVSKVRCGLFFLFHSCLQV